MRLFALISRSLPRPGTYTGIYVFEPHAQWLKNAVQLRHLAELGERVRRLEKQGKPPKKRSRS